MCRSPWLIAAYRALRRLRVPRHPPLAFARLTTPIVKQSTRADRSRGSLCEILQSRSRRANTASARADAPFLSMRFVSHSARHLAAASLSSILHLSISAAIALSVAESFVFYSLGQSLSTGLASFTAPRDQSVRRVAFSEGSE